MVSTGLALAACIVPPVCVVVVAVWTVAIYWRLKRLAGQKKGSTAPPATFASPLETVQLHPPSHPAFALASHRLPPRSTLDTHLSCSSTSILRTDLFASLPSPRPPPPPEPRFSIRTTFARDGSRVLARPTTGSAGHGEGQRAGEEAPARPARTRRDRGQFGIGSGDDDERWEVVQSDRRARLSNDDDRAGPIVVVDGEVTVTPRRRAGLTRRSSTWSAHDLEGVFLPRSTASPHSASHSIPLSAHAASLSPSRPGPRPLPPGARHEPSTRTSGEGGGTATSETSGEAGSTPLSSQESGGPLLGRVGEREGRHEWVERHWAGEVEYVSTGAQTDSTGINGVKALSSSAHARSRSDVSTATHGSFFFGTTTAPLPPGSASGSSAGHGQRRQSTWSTSTYEAVFTDLPTRSRPVRPSTAFQQRHAPPAPAPIDVRSLPERRNSHAVVCAPPALTHSATSPAALEPYSQRPIGTPARSTTLPPRHFHPREHPTSPWFASPSLAHPPPRPPPPPSHDWLPSAHLERLDARRERSAILAARRPVSWLGRQGSNGSLPDSVPAVGNLEVVNPDVEALTASAARPGLAR
ncbi:hypothetical protein JCM8208_003554 [Rhodotorula glutinis]